MNTEVLKRIFYIFLFLNSFYLLTNAQKRDTLYDEGEYYADEEEEKPRLNNRIFFGGNFGLSFGRESLIEISPLVGYRFTPKLSVAVGPVYQYYRYKSFNPAIGTIRFHNIGGRVFGRYIIYKNFFAQIEESLTFVKSNLYQAFGDSTKNGYIPVNDFLVGGGIRQPIGERAAVNLTILYNLTESEYTLNPNPVIRFDFVF